jgi:FdhD protein
VLNLSCRNDNSRVPVSDSSRPGATGRRPVSRFTAGGDAAAFDTVITEEPVEVRLAWPGQVAVRIAVVMRTPGHDFELACGFLLGEGALRLGQAPATVAYCLDRRLDPAQQYNVVTVTLDEPPARVPGARSTAVSSACGVCGTTSLDDVFPVGTQPIAATGALVSVSALAQMLTHMRSMQPLFDRTGAAHAAAVFRPSGELVVVREDVGRHNAVDKVLGARTLGSVQYDETGLLCVSGRVGFDIISKAVAGRIGVVAAVGGASSLAVDLARQAGITLCGFVRADRAVVYTGVSRIRGSDATLAVS